MPSENKDIVVGRVSVSLREKIPSMLTTKENEEVLEASLLVSSSRFHELSNMSRSVVGSSGYSMVEGTVSVPADHA